MLNCGHKSQSTLCDQAINFLGLLSIAFRQMSGINEENDLEAAGESPKQSKPPPS